MLLIRTQVARHAYFKVQHQIANTKLHDYDESTETRKQRRQTVDMHTLNREARVRARTHTRTAAVCAVVLALSWFKPQGAA